MIINISIILLSITSSSIAHVFLKKGMMVYALSSSIPSNMMERVFNVFINPWILGGILLHFLALAIWLWALSKVNITFAYPFIALGYVLVSLMAWRWLGEDLSLVKILGMGVIIVGILIVSSEM